MPTINYETFSNHAAYSIWDNLINSDCIKGCFECLVDVNDLQELDLQVQSYTEFNLERDFETTNTNPTRYLSFSGTRFTR